MNLQEMFDKVTNHLLIQMARARIWEGGVSRCLYLDRATGNKCAIGCLIPDGHEGQDSRQDVYGLLDKHGDLRTLLGIDSANSSAKGYLSVLQSIHDGYEPEEWEKRLRNFASLYNLAFNPHVAKAPVDYENY